MAPARVLDSGLFRPSDPRTCRGAAVILSNAFVYLHQPKTGGTFVTSMLERVGAACPELEVQVRHDLKHGGLRQIPRAYRDKPLVMSVRHPFDHYVSRYHFAEWETRMLSSGREALIRERYPDFPDVSFSDFLRLRNDWDVAIPRKAKNERLRQVLIDREIGFGTRRFVGMLAADARDLLERFDAMGDDELDACFAGVTFLSTETLNRDLYRFLTDIVGLDGERVSFVKVHEQVRPKRARDLVTNVRLLSRDKHRKEHWSAYFTPEDRAWLGHRERLLFRLFRDRYTVAGDPARRTG